MNENFWNGFEKRAGIPGFIGTAAGKLQKAPAATAKFVKDIPGNVQRGAEAVKQRLARNAQEMSAARARELGAKARVPNYATKTFKPSATNVVAGTSPLASGAAKSRANAGRYLPARPALDLSQKASKGRIMTGQASPESIRQAKGSLLGRARDLATIGLVAGGTGAYMGTKDQAQYEQPR